jgi:hypothetical protein
MNQADAEKELNWRLYQWVKEAITNEVNSDFPVLRQCQHERRILCFLEWMKDTPQNERLPICISLAKRSNKEALDEEDAWTSFDDGVDGAYDAAYSHYHESLPPTPNSDRYAPGFVKADLKRARDLIAAELIPSFGEPSKRPQRDLWYIRNHGDWKLKTVVELRSPRGSGEVRCYHFLWRSDFKYDTKPDDLVRKIDPIAKMGIWISRFSLLSISEEQLSAKAVGAVMDLFVPVFPKIVAGLDIAS